MSELQTYGDLKKLINGVIKNQKGEKILSKGKEIAIDQVLGFIPGASNAKSLFDFIKTAISKPDSQKTGTWLDKLDVDDDMSRIVDDTVENGFMQTMAKTIERENDTKPLEPDFNMNAQMVNYLKRQYNQRTISGIQESNIYKQNKKMKNESLKKLIKEEIKNLLELETAPAAAPAASPSAAPKTATEVKKLTDYLGGVGKAALTQINQPAELDSLLNAIFNGMNPAFQKNAKAVAIKKVIDMKLSV
jgi:hypothetical protein